MNLNKDKKISLVILILFLITLIIILIYINSVFDLAFKIGNEIKLYKIKKLAREISGGLELKNINTANTEVNKKTPLPTVLNNPTKGPSTAKITIFIFSDFSCPVCATMVEPLNQVETAYGDKVRIVWKDFPLSTIHPLSQEAALAARCAGEQEGFWPYHDFLFANQEKFSNEFFSSLAKELNLDLEKFDSCLGSGRMAPLIQKDYEEGISLGVDGTPYIFINDKRIPNATSFEQLKEIIDTELLLNK